VCIKLESIDLNLLKSISEFDFYNDKKYISWKEKYDQQKDLQIEEEFVNDACFAEITLEWTTPRIEDHPNCIDIFIFKIKILSVDSDYDDEENEFIYYFDNQSIRKVIKLFCVNKAEITDYVGHKLLEKYFGHNAETI